MKKGLLFIMMLAAFMTAACSDPLPIQEPSQQEYARVLIYFGEGMNSLSSYIIEDTKDLIGAPTNALLPSEGSNKALIVISHLPTQKGDWMTPTCPTITRVSRDYLGRPICDTLLRMPAGTIMTKADNLRSALEYVQSNFPSDSYGLILSSHGTGWLPAGYYDRDENGSSLMQASRPTPEGAVHYVERPSPDGIDVKSFGQEIQKQYGSLYSYEMSLNSLAKAIPMRLDYMLIDACLMGGIETAYELRNVTRYLGFSQTEVLADGLTYNTLLKPLLDETPANPQAVCEEYFNKYNERTGLYQSATISLIDCSRLEGFAECCRNLFQTYREQMASINYKDVQGFFRYDKHWFFDLEDIMVKAGISPSDKKELSAALGECVLYKAHTNSFMEDFDIKTMCGFSMYLPAAGDSYLNSYYSELEWNKATGLVE